MSLSLIRFAALSLSLPLVACVADGSASDGTSSDPISKEESATTTAAVESTVVAMAPITSTSAATIAAQYKAAFPSGGASCATVATDNLTYVNVTFACTGALATNGSIHLQLTSPTTIEATTDLTIGGVSIGGSLQLSLPADPAAQHTLHGELTIEGPRRMLTADAMASWTSSGPCVTYSSSGNVSAEGPRGSAMSAFEVNAKTVCR